MQWQQTAKIPLITDGIINPFADSHSIHHNDTSQVPVYSHVTVTCTVDIKQEQMQRNTEEIHGQYPYINENSVS
jgi:hypothetical protein